MHASSQLPIPPLNFIHFVVNIIVVIAQAIIAAEAGEPGLTALSRLFLSHFYFFKKFETLICYSEYFLFELENTKI